MRLTNAERVTKRQEAFERATTVQSLRNYGTVIGEFMERGIPESEIIPQVNVLTYGAWQHLGRQVRKGEKSVRIVVWVPCKGSKDKATETPTDEQKKSGRMYPKTAFVFHISQTDAKAQN